MSLKSKLVNISEYDYFAISQNMSKSLGPFTYIYYSTTISYNFEIGIFNNDFAFQAVGVSVNGKFE